MSWTYAFSILSVCVFGCVLGLPSGFSSIALASKAREQALQSSDSRPVTDAIDSTKAEYLKKEKALGKSKEKSEKPTEKPVEKISPSADEDPD